MKKELIIVILAVIGIIGISVLLKFVIFKNYSKISANYNKEPLSECVQCLDNQTWDNRPCCDRDFSRLCSEKQGVIRFRDLRPVFSGLLQSCYQTSPDVGQSCVSGQDCLSGVCSFLNAISSNVCSLVKKEITGKNQYSNEDFFVATYTCSDKKPGKCASAIDNINSPNGTSHFYKMDGKNLTEIQEAGPIN